MDPLGIKTWLKWGAIAVILGAIWYAIHSYNVWVTAKAVSAVEAKYTGDFNRITEQAKELKRTINDNAVKARLAQSEAVAKEQEKANAATIRYNQELARAKTIAADRDRILAANNDLLGRMLNTSTASISGSAGSTGVGQYASDLGARYAACERDLAEAVGEAAKAIDRAGVAEAAVRALMRDSK